MRKPVFRVSDLVRHKQGCTATEEGQRLEISYLGSRGIVLCSENKGADQLRRHHADDLCPCLRQCKKQVFSRHGSYDFMEIVAVLVSTI